MDFTGGAVGLAALTAASITDIKTREVPDWISIGLGFYAVGNALLLSIIREDPQYIFSSLTGLALGVAIGLTMFYTGQWGGGDSKLVISLSALMGLYFTSSKLIMFLALTLLVGTAYGIGYSLFMAIKHFKSIKPVLEETLRSKNVFTVRIILLIIVFACFANFMLNAGYESTIILGFSLLLFLMLYIWVLVTTVEKVCMIMHVPVSTLTEGDWVIEPVIKNKIVIVDNSKTGVTLEQIKELKRHKIEKVKIKIGIPFVPSFLIAYVLAYLI